MPALLNATMPSTEYARYAAFWTQTLEICMVFLTLLVAAALISLRLLVVQPILDAVSRLGR